MEKQSLFDRIGGMEILNEAVRIFYSKVINDDRVSKFFESIDMNTQSLKLKMFLAYAFGARLNYDGRSMREAHSRMNLDEGHFNAVAEHLVGTLRDLKVDESLINEVVAIALSTKNDVLNK